METILSPSLYYILSGLLVLGVLIGLSLMSRVNLARAGNALSSVCMAAAVLITLYNYNVLSSALIWAAIATGAVISLICAAKVKMIQMPQVVAFLNGLGGLSSALVAICTAGQATNNFSYISALIALIIGFLTFTGSLIAAGKLAKLLSGKRIIWKAHTAIIVCTVILTVIFVIFKAPIWLISLLAAFFGIAFSVRVGGADMPITISLLNSLSGVAAGIAGIAVGDIMLTAIGGIVGASGLLLTQIMCRAMNRSLVNILLGTASAAQKTKENAPEKAAEEKEEQADVINEEQKAKPSAGEILKNAKKVMIVPGYGMALAQAQSKVAELADKLTERGAEVKFAIHPVAGRMPGHMNVLLCEADVPYDKLYEMDAVNGEFSECDAAIIVGANDVVNPAANTAEGTPIYGMPVLNAADAKNIIVCNFDENPGYAGVVNPLYKNEKTIMILGDAKETVAGLIEEI